MKIWVGKIVTIYNVQFDLWLAIARRKLFFIVHQLQEKMHGEGGRSVDSLC